MVGLVAESACPCGSPSGCAGSRAGRTRRCRRCRSGTPPAATPSACRSTGCRTRCPCRPAGRPPWPPCAGRRRVVDRPVRAVVRERQVEAAHVLVVLEAAVPRTTAPALTFVPSESTAPATAPPSTTSDSTDVPITSSMLSCASTYSRYTAHWSGAIRFLPSASNGYQLPRPNASGSEPAYNS